MMKKLLVLMLVLGMASLASAALTLSVVDNTGGSYTVSIIGGPYGPFQGDVWTLVTDNGTITGGTPVVITDLTNTIIGAVETNPAVMNGEGEVGLWGSTLWGNFITPLPALTTMYTSFSVTATSVGTIDLYSGVVENSTMGSIVDSAPIVPEPMTLALLGLGGLFLRRKK